MALARYPSRVFAAWRSVYTLLSAATWPAHPVGASTPIVTLADSIPDDQREVVAIVPTTPEDTIEWVQMGAASREERFGLDIVIRTRVPGVPGFASGGGDVVTRLESLANVVQARFYNTTTGAFTPPAFDGVQQLGGIATVEPAVFPDSEGWSGDCVMRLLLLARI